MEQVTGWRLMRSGQLIGHRQGGLQQASYRRWNFDDIQTNQRVPADSSVALVKNEMKLIIALSTQ